MRQARFGLRVTRRHLLIACLGGTALGLASACAAPAQPAPATVAPAQATSAPAQPAPATSAPAAPTAAPTMAPAAATKPAGPKRGGTFTVARTGGVTEFNPFRSSIGNYAYMGALFDTLTWLDDKMNPQPGLAERWDVSADGLTVTFKLRQGVKFHSGREFTSADVKASWEFGSTDETATMRSMFQSVKQVETPDKYSAVFKLGKLFPALFDMFDLLWIIDKETFANRANTAIGTGPFKMERYLPNDRAEMVAFRDYWDAGKPYLDRYVLRQIPDTASLTINLEAGSVDAIWVPSAADYLRLKAAGGKFFTMTGALGQSMFDVGMNVTRGPLQNKKVRQAIAWSIDRARFCRTSLQGQSEPSCLIWPQSSWAYFKDLEGRIGYDLDKAKALLKEAGFENGFETELLCSTGVGSAYTELALIMQADLKKIGINAKVSDVDEARYRAATTSGDIPIVMHSYGRANRDPGTTVTAAKAWVNEKEGNWTHWNSPEWDKLRTDLNASLDREKRLPIARKLQEMALDECFTTVIAPKMSPWVLGQYVKGFWYTLEDVPKVGDVWLDK